MRAIKFRMMQGAVFFALWIMISGHMDTLFMLLGLGSSILVVWLASRMCLAIPAGATLPSFLGAPGYAVWLAREILVSNIKVARIILDPDLPVRPVLFYARARQKTDLGRVIFANSITLTPGTISVAISDTGDRILVHALHDGMSWGPDGHAMDARICALGV